MPHAPTCCNPPLMAGDWASWGTALLGVRRWRRPVEPNHQNRKDLLPPSNKSRVCRGTFPSHLSLSLSLSLSRVLSFSFRKTWLRAFRVFYILQGFHKYLLESVLEYQVPPQCRKALCLVVMFQVLCSWRCPTRQAFSNDTQKRIERTFCSVPGGKESRTNQTITRGSSKGMVFRPQGFPWAV